MATADLGATEAACPLSLSPLIDLRRAYGSRGNARLATNYFPSATSSRAVLARSFGGTGIPSLGVMSRAHGQGEHQRSLSVHGNKRIKKIVFPLQPTAGSESL